MLDPAQIYYSPRMREFLFAEGRNICKNDSATSWIFSAGEKGHKAQQGKRKNE